MLEIAKRGIRKVHIWSYVLYFTRIFLGGLVVGIGAGSLSTSLSKGEAIDWSSIAFIVIGVVVVIIGAIALMSLAIMHDKNRKNKHPYLIEFNQDKGEFTFYPLKGEEIVLKKEEPITLICALTGNNQTFLVYKDQKVNLGFTKEGLEVILSQIRSAKGQ